MWAPKAHIQNPVLNLSNIICSGVEGVEKNRRGKLTFQGKAKSALYERV